MVREVREVREDVAVLPLLDKWLEGQMAQKEVMMAAGVRKLFPIVEAARNEQYDIEVWEDFKAMTQEDHKRVKLERLAYEIYGNFLHEEPGYLNAVVTKLGYKKQKNMRRIGAALGKECIEGRSRSGRNRRYPAVPSYLPQCDRRTCLPSFPAV